MNDKEFIQLIKENQGIIHKVCNIYCSSNQDSKDLRQEIILQLWNSLPQFRNESKFSTWLYKVALNTALTFQKINRRQLQKNDLKNYQPQKEKSLYSDKEIILWLYKSIQKLNNLDKAVALLYLEEKSYTEISQITGFPKEQIPMKISRIKLKLQKILLPIINELKNK